MSIHPFTVSLNSNIQVTSTEDSYTLHKAESDPTTLLTLVTTPGIGLAIDRLKAGNTTTESLVQALAELDGRAAGEQLAMRLQQLDERGWLNYAVLPLAVATPMLETAQLNPCDSDWIHTSVSLAPSASQRPHGGVMVLESPDSEFQVKLLDWRANALLAQLATPTPLAKLTPPPDVGPETAYQFLDLLRAAGFLTIGDEPSSFGIDASEDSEELAVDLNEVDEALSTAQLTEMVGDEADATEYDIQPTETTDTLQTTTEVINSEALPSDAESDVGEDEIEPAVVSANESENSASQMSIALHPHDLDDRIPGLVELHNQTLGDPRITVVIIDGEPDYDLACLQGAEVSKVFPYWHEPAEPVPQKDYATFQDIRDQGLKGKAKQEAIEAAIPETRNRVMLNDHACHVTSIIIGQEDSPVFGLAPRCRAINMPQDGILKPDDDVALSGYSEMLSPLNMARALEYALELGANIIHCGFCRPTQTGEGEELLVQAVKKCQQNNVLIVSPTGNNLGECWCMPAVLPGTLAVGAAKVDGTPCHFSNWGGNNAEEGILAPGEDILGAQPYTDKPVRLTGTSMSAPVMTGISALLMSLQLQQGKPVDAEAVRTALLNTAIPCDPEVVEEPERCLRGSVNIPGAMDVLFGQPSVTISFAGDQVTRTEHTGYASVAPAGTPNTAPAPATETASPEPTDTPAPAETAATPSTQSANPSAVKASTAFSGNVYAIGSLGYDFGDEARRDTFKQLMAPADLDGIMVPPDPYDVRQMIEHLDRHPDEAKSLTWTLSLEHNVVYALEPKGSFASDVYEVLLLMLAGQLEPKDSPGFVERMSVAARRTNRTVELFSGEVVPVVTVQQVRGMYGWTVNALLDAALGTLSEALDPEQELLVRAGLDAFLNRIYHDLHNLGQTSRDRALNFAATNIFQSASVFAEAIADGRQLDTISVEKSPYCRLNSDCWDVILTFFDPEHGRRSRKVFRFTIDVAANLPVTIGNIRRWSIPGKKHGQA